MSVRRITIVTPVKPGQKIAAHILFFGSQFGAIGIGILADSAAMQWAGFVMLIIALCGVAVAIADRPMTIPEARKLLDRLEAEA